MQNTYSVANATNTMLAHKNKERNNKVTKMYFKSDGNGGYNIGKNTIAIISILILLIGMMMPIVFGYGQLNNKVENLIVHYDNAKTSHVNTINGINDKNVEQDVQIAIINTKLDQIISILEEQ